MELEPACADGYTAAAEALLAMARTDVEEANALLAQGAQESDAQAIVRWAQDHPVDFWIEPPFAPDYTSEAQINLDGITVANQTNAAKYQGEWKGGLVTWQGDWIYFSAADEGYAIYKVRSDGTQYQRVGELCGTSLNVIGDWMYYINTGDGVGTAWKARTDGTLAEPISEDSCGFLSVEGEYQFYSSGNDGACLYRANLDGSEPVKLYDGMVMFPCVADGWVYFSPKSMTGGLWRIGAQGDNLQQLCGGFIQNYAIWDGWIYFLDVNDPVCVRRIRTDGSLYEEILPFEKPITALNVADGRLVIAFDSIHEEDGFFVAGRITAYDLVTLLPLWEKETDTEAICFGPNGTLLLQSFRENLRWHLLDAEGGMREFVHKQ